MVIYDDVSEFIGRGFITDAGTDIDSDEACWEVRVVCVM
jgi:hypothetical protein